MSYLKTCPFCGGEPEIDESFIFSKIVCEKCGARTKPCDTADEAIEEWNLRANRELAVYEAVISEIGYKLGVQCYDNNGRIRSATAICEDFYRALERSNP